MHAIPYNTEDYVRTMIMERVEQMPLQALFQLLKHVDEDFDIVVPTYKDVDALVDNNSWKKHQIHEDL